MDEWRLSFEEELQRTMKRLYPDEQVLHRACRYALEGQGKRIRPLLTLAAATACAPRSWREAMPAAVALEMVHTYSLVHDDLPCMDNDDLRRGRLTTHKAFDTGMAMLAGDALLTDAFTVITDVQDWSAEQKVAMVSILSRAAGGRGMVYGQALDVGWTGRHDYQAADLDAIHTNKTGQLIQAACLLGAWVGRGSPAQREQLALFGASVGLAFQIIDDLIDEGPLTGKTPGKDKAIGKLTYLSVMGREAAQQKAQELTSRALRALDGFGDQAAALHDLARLLLQRQY